jgi:RHS repeat-associated protein
LTIKYPESTPVGYEYGAMGAAYNRAGRIFRVTDESGVEERYYGELGEIIKEEKTVEAKTPPVQRKKFTTEYEFDSFGRMLEMTYPDGEKLRYAYDNGGLLKAAWGEKAGNRYDYIKSLTYDEFDQKTLVVNGNDTKMVYVYDPRSRRLTNLTTTQKDERVIQKLIYNYDLVGNIKKLTNDISTPTNTALPAGPLVQNYEYDDLYQLTSGNGAYSFGPGKQNTYTSKFTYDAIGNMLTKVQEHRIIQPSQSAHLPKETNYTLTYQYGSAKPHAVTETEDKKYTYDPAGNMTGWTSKQNGTRRVITWNEENRVKQIDDNGKSTYFLYNDAGERVVKRGQHGESIYVNTFYSVRNGELGTKHIFAGDTRVLSKLVKTPNTVTANSPATSTSASETTSTTTIPGEQGLDHGQGKKLGIIKRLPDGNQTGVNPPVEKDQFYYHGDHLGSSNIITDTYGAVYQHLEYFPFGETWIEEGGSYGGNTPGYKFTGKELDPETGLYYYGARYYDAVLSKWLSPDPMLERYLDGSPAGGIYVPQNLGVYTYTHNNPVVYVDPQGKWVLKAARIAWKVAVKGENIYSLVSGVVENAKIISDPDAGWGAKLLAATDIALDVTTGFRVKDVKKAIKSAEKGLETLRDTKRKLEQRAEAAKRGKDVAKGAPVHGKPQVTKKAGVETKHGSTSDRVAKEEAQRSDAESVHMNQTLGTVSGGELTSKVRPDVATVRKDGKIDVTEVLSPGQSEKQMRAKYKDALGDRAGNIRIIDPDK